MDYLILGSTGLLGKTLLTTVKKRNLEVLGLSRKTKKYKINYFKINNLLKILEYLKPKIIINSVGLVDIDFCEKKSKIAEKINALPLKYLSKFSKKNNIKLVQISTDHFFTGDQNRKHKENSKIKILNTYAKTKFLAEKYTKLNKNHIIIRTNFTGYRNKTNNQTFIEWLLENLKKKKNFYLFDDFYCSTIDIKSLSNVIFDLIDLDFKGTINIGSRDTFSKKKFAIRVADILKLDKDLILEGSVKSLKTKRAESLGLDVTKVERILKYKMPSLKKVCENLVKNKK